MNRISILQPIQTLSRLTFKELLHDRMLYNLGIGIIIMFFFSMILSQLAIQRVSIFQTSFSLSALQWALAVLSILIGSSILNRDFKRKTYFLFKVRPIYPAQILLGKFMGAAVFLGVSLLVFSFFNGIFIGMLEGQLTYQLVSAFMLSFMEALCLLALSLFFSIHSSIPVASGITLGFWLVGNNLSLLEKIALKSDSVFIKSLNSIAQFLFPHLETFHLNASAIYELPISGYYIIGSIAYGTCYVSCILVLSIVLLRKKAV